MFIAHPDLPSLPSHKSLAWTSLGHHPASCRGTIPIHPYPLQPTTISWSWRDTHLSTSPVWAGQRGRYNLLSTGATQNVCGAQVCPDLLSTAGGWFIYVKVCAWTDVHAAALFQGGNKFSGWYSFAENWPNLGLAKKRKKTKAFCCITWHLMGKMQFSFLSIWEKYFLLADILLRGDKPFIVTNLAGIQVLGTSLIPASSQFPSQALAANSRQAILWTQKKRMLWSGHLMKG